MTLGCIWHDLIDLIYKSLNCPTKNYQKINSNSLHAPPLMPHSQLRTLNISSKLQLVIESKNGAERSKFSGWSGGKFISTVLNHAHVMGAYHTWEPGHSLLWAQRWELNYSVPQVLGSLSVPQKSWEINIKKVFKKASSICQWCIISRLVPHFLFLVP